MEINSLFIIKRESGVALYHKDFTESGFDPQLLSSFLVAMTSFFDEATRSVTSQARAFEGADYKIVVEFGEWTLGAISINEDSALVRDKLKRMITRFEEQFNVLRWVDIDLAIHSRFEASVMDEFIRDLIKPDTMMTVRAEWEYYTKRTDVQSFLRLIPSICSVEDAARFLEVPIEVALNIAAEALWDNAITVYNPVKPDDIYQVTDFTSKPESDETLSAGSVKVLNEIDGETPLSIAAERLRTSDLKKFLHDVAILEKRRMIELVTPAHAIAVRYSAALQTLLRNSAMIVGQNVMRKVFFVSKGELVENYPWLAYLTLEVGVDIEMRSSLVAATIKGSISPEVLNDGFRAIMQFITHRVKDLTGTNPMNMIVMNTKEEIEIQFPSTVYDIEWETLTV
ncbi:MAG: hypothetical protein ACXAAO_10750 [Candidatus Thorarchaeota archaeon]|jgi:hypothetical protein